MRKKIYRNKNKYLVIKTADNIDTTESIPITSFTFAMISLQHTIHINLETDFHAISVIFSFFFYNVQYALV